MYLIQITQQRQVYLTGIPILTAERRPGDTVANILVKSLPRGVHALQVRNTDATYLIPVSCPDVSIPVALVPRAQAAPTTPKPRPEADPVLQEQLLEFDKVCKEVKERSAPARPSKKATKEVATRNDEEHKHAKIYAILAEYHKKLANSPDLNNKPAPRRRSAPSSGGAVVAKRKKVAVPVESPPEQIKRPTKEAESPSGPLVNYVSIVRPLRIALGGQRLVALSGATLPTAASTTVQTQVIIKKILRGSSKNLSLN